MSLAWLPDSPCPVQHFFHCFWILWISALVLVDCRCQVAPSQGEWPNTRAVRLRRVGHPRHGNLDELLDTLKPSDRLIMFNSFEVVLARNLFVPRLHRHLAWCSAKDAIIGFFTLPDWMCCYLYWTLHSSNTKDPAMREYWGSQFALDKYAGTNGDTYIW